MLSRKFTITFVMEAVFANFQADSKDSIIPLYQQINFAQIV